MTLSFSQLKKSDRFIYLLNGAESIDSFNTVSQLLKNNKGLLLDEDLFDGIWYKTIKFSHESHSFIFGFHDDIGCYFEIINESNDENNWLANIVKSVCDSML